MKHAQNMRRARGPRIKTPEQIAEMDRAADRKHQYNLGKARIYAEERKAIHRAFNERR